MRDRATGGGASIERAHVHGPVSNPLGVGLLLPG
jgi:hypothetical protein